MTEFSRCAGKLDLRFADEDDAPEIAALVKEVCSSEGELFWRSSTDKVTSEGVVSDCISGKTRWIVLETPVPEETVVGTVRLSILEAERKGVVDIICALGENNSVYNQLLARVEGIARGMGITNMVVKLDQWKESMYDWLCGCGYVDIAGSECKDENLIKPTMILDMYKDLTKSQEAQCIADSTPISVPHVEESLEDLLGEIDINSIESSGTVGSVANPNPMENLMGDLFAALHKEYPGGW